MKLTISTYLVVKFEAIFFSQDFTSEVSVGSSLPYAATILVLCVVHFKNIASHCVTDFALCASTFVFLASNSVALLLLTHLQVNWKLFLKHFFALLNTFWS